MSAYLHSTSRRLAFALALSILLHALFLWLPGLWLPRVQMHPSLLTVRMESSAKQPVAAGNPEDKQGAPWMDIWLGTEYHMLPVRLQKIEPDGKIAMEMAIKEIRVSDDQPKK